MFTEHELRHESEAGLHRRLRETPETAPGADKVRAELERRDSLAASRVTPAYAKAVANIHWFHAFDFGGGLYTQGKEAAAAFRGKADAVFRHGVAGKTVLDIGAWDGFFSFEAERRGASRVLATDHFCWSGPGWGTKHGFDLAKSIFNSRVEERDVPVEKLSPETVGMFDVVLYLGVLYHVFDLIGHLKTVYSLTREYAVIETALDFTEIDRPAISFVRGSTMPRPDVPLSNDPTNFFGPNPAAVIAMLEFVGFSRIEHEVYGGGPAGAAPRGFFYAYR